VAHYVSKALLGYYFVGIIRKINMNFENNI